jgi:hypothetical protein
MKKILYALLLCLSASSNLFAQYDDPYQYYPMAVGNYWYYSAGTNYYYSEKICADSIDSAGNKFFWMYSKYSGDRPDRCIDTSYFFITDPKNKLGNSEYLYKLNAEVGDSWWVQRKDTTDLNVGTWCKIFKISDGTYLGIETRFKTYMYYVRVKDNQNYYDFWDHNEILAYEIGMVYRDNDASYPSNLLGAIIDGKTIGNPVDVKEDLASKIPDSFELYQNYPNPFNPSTTIKFQIPQNGKARLTLFNMLGEKIADLLDGYIGAGEHHIYVDFSKYNCGSGIYMYSLVYNEKAVSKKMVYIK